MIFVLCLSLCPLPGSRLQLRRGAWALQPHSAIPTSAAQPVLSGDIRCHPRRPFARTGASTGRPVQRSRTAGGIPVSQPGHDTGLAPTTPLSPVGRRLRDPDDIENEDGDAAAVRHRGSNDWQLTEQNVEVMSVTYRDRNRNLVIQALDYVPNRPDCHDLGTIVFGVLSPQRWLRKDVDVTGHRPPPFCNEGVRRLTNPISLRGYISIRVEGHISSCRHRSPMNVCSRDDYDSSPNPIR